MPGPNLASIESDAPMDTTNDKLFGGVRNVIYTATSQAFEGYQKLLEKYEMHHKDALTVRSKLTSHLQYRTIINSTPAKTLTPKQRLLCTPIVRGYCLTSKSWGKISLRIKR
jgi:hypothetical protein